MTFTDPPDNRATELMEALLTDSISEEEGHELAKRLDTDADFRAYYIDSLGMDATMQKEFEHYSDTSLLEAVPTKSSKGKLSLITIGIGIASVAAAITAVVLFQQLPKEINADSIAEHSALGDLTNAESIYLEPSSMARVIYSENTEWADSSNQTIITGSWLQPGIYELKKGYATIEFDSGATMGVKANTKFEVSSNNKSRIIKGEVNAKIPAYNRDFQIELPHDIITEEANNFAVRVNEDDSSEIQVINGSAIVKHMDQVIKTISANNDATKVSKGGECTSTKRFALSKFPKKQEVHNAPYMHFSFDNLNNTTQLFSQGTSYPPVEAFVVSEEPKQVHGKGRFGNAFKADGQRTYIDTNYKGILGSSPRTVAFWVKLPENISRKYAHSIASWGASKGGQKWQISWNVGRLTKGEVGAIKADVGYGYIIGTQDLRDGRWHHVAIVYAGGQSEQITKNIKFYVDGKLDPISASKDHKVDTQVGASNFKIGCKLGIPSDQYSGFKGLLDEMYIFEAALTPSQIHTLRKTNKPPVEGQFIPSIVNQMVYK